MSDAPPPAVPRVCRCGLRPCRPGQRLCGPCHLAYKRTRRATPRPARATPKETPKETAGETGPGRETEGNGVVHASFVSPLKRRRPGPQVPADWPTRFLEYYAKHGTRWLAAKQAGVVYETVLRFEHADPAFAREVENARQEFADSQEQRLRKIGQKGNPVGPIVLLKKHRPGEYVEKNMTVSASFTGTLNPEDGKALLQAMLGHAPEAPLPPPGPDPTRGVLDGEPGGPESAQPSE